MLYVYDYYYVDIYCYKEDSRSACYSLLFSPYQGLGKSCQYGMVVVVETQGADFIQDRSVQDHQRVYLSQTLASSIIYRYV